MLAARLIKIYIISNYLPTGSVASTPTFFLNDVPLAADPTWTLTEWKEVIDPLLKAVKTIAENKVKYLIFYGINWTIM